RGGCGRGSRVLVGREVDAGHQPHGTVVEGDQHEAVPRVVTQLVGQCRQDIGRPAQANGIHGPPLTGAAARPQETVSRLWTGSGSRGTSGPRPRILDGSQRTTCPGTVSDGVPDLVSDGAPDLVSDGVP